MRTRIVFGRLLIRLGNFIESLAIMVMRPADLVEFGRQMYARPHNVAGWGHQDTIDGGLATDEKALLERLPSRKGPLLLLGLGGGREAIPLVRAGFEVTGVDFVPAMVEQAQQNAAQRGVSITGLVQEISQLDVTPGSYDVVWLSAKMYSCVPTQRRRVAMLRRIRQALSPGGYFVCQFHWGSSDKRSPTVELIRQVVAHLTLGNLSYEEGDMLWWNVEFVHGFLSEKELCAEFEEGGFDVVHLQICDSMLRGGAILVGKHRSGVAPI